MKSGKISTCHKYTVPTVSISCSIVHAWSEKLKYYKLDTKWDI